MLFIKFLGSWIHLHGRIPRNHTATRSTSSSRGIVLNLDSLLAERWYSATEYILNSETSLHRQSTSASRPFAGWLTKRRTMDFSVRNWPREFAESKEPNVSVSESGTGSPS